MGRKTCKTPMCLAEVWRNSQFSYSDYCWEHDPTVKEAKQRMVKGQTGGKK